MVAFLCLFKKEANHVVIAACTFLVKKKYKLTTKRGNKMTSSELLHFWKCGRNGMAG